MKKQKFVHLHVHTEYSLLDGLSKIGQLVTRVKEMGMDSLAISDHGVMYGAIEFYKKAKDAGIKPIIGMEAYTTKEDHKKKPERGRTQNFHLLLLAKNRQGYENLMKLSSIGHLEGYYYRPRFDRETLKKYAKGLVCTSACMQGEVARALIAEDYKLARETAKWFLDVFGEDYYLEVQRHHNDRYAQKATDVQIRQRLLTGHEEEKKVNTGVVKLSRELGIPIVATNDAHYIEKKDASAQDALVCIATGKNISDKKRLRFIDQPDFYIKSPAEMAEEFSDLPESLENSVKIAAKCNLEIKLGQWLFPEVSLVEKKSPEKVLRQRAKKALKSKFKKVTKELSERLEYELDIIIKKGYAPYFLMFQDMANWANRRKIPINTRGSAAGSLVSHVLEITNVDPVKYQLPFERFLNPMRPKPPDIDLDIADDKREEMIAYLTKTYGKDKVAQICTFGRMLARASVRDVARVMGYPYAVGDKIAKLIPPGSQGFPMSIDRALKESSELNELYKSDSDTKKVIGLARQVEGNARHISVHAAGLVVTPGKITDFTPVQKEPSGEKTITQYEMNACEDIGLVKLDVLGIRNLSILRNAVRLVKEIQGKDIKLNQIPLDDKKTFEMLSRGETMGTFQLGGSGMTRYLVELQPERLEDIMAMIALFRPGPMANIPEYIARKKGQKPVEYYHPKMKKFLDKSFGILVYQEDLLFTAIELAGYDWEEVDKFRKAVGKKIPEEMAKQHKIFVAGCIKHSGMSKKEAEGIWELFEPFQGYGFNKAHAASYGIIAYQTAFMKANFPVEYMTALMTCESGDTDKIAQAVNEARRMGIKVLPPDINKSQVDFTVDDGAIRFGLSAIKHVGEAAIEAIVGAREQGPFNSFADFVARVDNRKVNKKVLESLIKVGAMSDFGKRAALLASLEEIRSKVGKSNTNSDQQGLFSGKEMSNQTAASQILINESVDEFSDDELQSLERQLLGLSLSAKPISEIIDSFSDLRTHRIYDISPEEMVDTNIRIAAIVSSVRTIVTRRSGQEMAFVKVEDDTGTLDLVVFPNVYQETRDLWQESNPLLISGKVDLRDESASLIVNAVDTPDSAKNKPNTFYVTIPAKTTKKHLSKLKKLFLENQGQDEVTLIFPSGDRINLNFGVAWDKTLSNKIAHLFKDLET